jgi:hypothetical protein
VVATEPVYTTSAPTEETDRWKNDTKDRFWRNSGFDMGRIDKEPVVVDSRNERPITALASNELRPTKTSDFIGSKLPKILFLLLVVGIIGGQQLQLRRLRTELDREMLAYGRVLQRLEERMETHAGLLTQLVTDSLRAVALETTPAVPVKPSTLGTNKTLEQSPLHRNPRQ